ncbi:uncharacterized protein LOC143177746 isoform X2 [Calliopsis andreniformis]|uniref:uncharacterized protein LOC143177746 isoform X2 n=1 Tax=Calliopsis andreniformis TaxID=337506 RepID=UPI003FCCB4E4
MAAPDVLQFNCSIENEVAQNATKDFAGMLQRAFEQYKKLWNEYLTLRKYCEDIDVKIPFQVLQSESYQNKNVVLSNISTECVRNSSDIMSDFDDSTLRNYISLEKQTRQDELLKSPVLIKKRKCRRSDVVQGCTILEDSEENALLPMKKNILISANNADQNILEVSVDSSRSECSLNENNDQIECTPVSKMSKKLGVSKLYNVDTTLLQSGKKFRQSKLVFLSTEQNTDKTASKMDNTNCLRPHVSPTPEKNIKMNLKNRIKSVDEEIIEDSPTKRKNFNLKVKCLKLKKKSPIKHSGKDNKFADSKMSRREMLLTRGKKQIQSSESQYLPHVQKDELYSVKKSKTFGSAYNESIESNCDILSSSVFTSIEDGPVTCLSTPVKESNEIKATKNYYQAQKKKCLELTSQSLNSDSSAYDETYCVLGEKLKEDPDHDSENIKEKVSAGSPPVKKSLMNSFDLVPEKEDISEYKSKSKSERAKMTGIACWECKQALNLLL